MPKKKEKTCEIVCVIDRSGSMESIIDDSIGGLNTFIEEQKKLPGKANVTVVLFDHEYIIHHDGIPINKVDTFTRDNYLPRGSTALLDAIGRAITTVSERLNKDKTKPDSVIVAILTDGQENASKEYSKAKIQELIKKQQEEVKWEFLYLSADENAMQDAVQYGIPSANVAQFAATGAGTKAAYRSMTNLTSSIRGK